MVMHTDLNLLTVLTYAVDYLKVRIVYKACRSAVGIRPLRWLE